VLVVGTFNENMKQNFATLVLIHYVVALQHFNPLFALIPGVVV
jgi:hypothetical protein